MTNKNLRQQTQNLLQKAKYYLALIFVDFSFALSVFMRPLTLISLVLILAILIYTQTQQGTNRLIFEIIASVIGGIIGGLITEKFIQLTGNNYIVKKSIGAIRNLQLIKFKVANINERIGQLKGGVNERDFEEIENLVNNIHKDILNSIGDWGDVNPGSETIKDYYELLEVKQSEIKNLVNEKKNLERQRDDLESSKKAEKSKLGKEINDKEKEIEDLKSQVQKLSLQGIEIETGSFLSGPSGTYPGTIVSGESSLRKCSNCGIAYYPNLLSSYVTADNLCDNCRRIQGI